MSANSVATSVKVQIGQSPSAIENDSRQSSSATGVAAIALERNDLDQVVQASEVGAVARVEPR